MYCFPIQKMQVFILEIYKDFIFQLYKRSHFTCSYNCLESSQQVYFKKVVYFHQICHFCHLAMFFHPIKILLSLSKTLQHYSQTGTSVFSLIFSVSRLNKNAKYRFLTQNVWVQNKVYRFKLFGQIPKYTFDL